MCQEVNIGSPSKVSGAAIELIMDVTSKWDDYHVKDFTVEVYMHAGILDVS